MRRPWVVAMAAGVLVLLVAMALPLLHMAGPGASTALAGDEPVTTGLPWQVTRLAGGRAQVFGLEPGRDSLDAVRRHLGDGVQVALVARLGEPPVLEALADPYQAGFVSGRLVLAFDAPLARRQAWLAAATGSEPMAGGARRFTLRAADLAAAGSATLVGLSFVPALRLDDADLRQRFGAPAETLPQAGGTLVLLYPEMGLSATVQPGSRGVLQYVAPAEFEARLRAPLRTPAPG